MADERPNWKIGDKVREREGDRRNQVMTIVGFEWSEIMQDVTILCQHVEDGRLISTGYLPAEMLIDAE
jgi:hypothetical protein